MIDTSSNIMITKIFQGLFNFSILDLQVFLNWEAFTFPIRIGCLYFKSVFTSILNWVILLNNQKMKLFDKINYPVNWFFLFHFIWYLTVIKSPKLSHGNPTHKQFLSSIVPLKYGSCLGLIIKARLKLKKASEIVDTKTSCKIYFLMSIIFLSEHN